MNQLPWDLRAPWASDRRGGTAGEVADDGADSATDDRTVLRDHGLPTCALAVLRLHVASWEAMSTECGSLAGVFAPPY
jgi:hypothetical protein